MAGVPASTADKPARRWQPERAPRRRWLVPLIAVVLAAAIIGAFVGGHHVAARTAERPRLMDSGMDATMDGGQAPRGRLHAGAELASGTGAKLRLQWDDGILVDLGID